MIIVAEGISAAGKTTFARQFAEGRWLPEMPVQIERGHGFPEPSSLLPEIEQHAAERSAHRYDVRAFEALIEALPA